MARISDLFDLADRPRDESVPEVACQLSDLFEEALRGSPNDIPTRFTVLSFYSALANHPGPPVPEPQYEMSAEGDVIWCEDSPTREQEASTERNKARHRQTLKHFVRMRQVEEIGTWREMRWEILNSYLIDWARAGKLYDRAEELGLLGTKDICLLRGQFNYLRVFDCMIGGCLRFFFKSSRFSDSRYMLQSLNWEPKVYERVEGVPIKDQDVGYAGLFLSGICFSFGDEVFLLPMGRRAPFARDPEMDQEAYFEYHEAVLARFHDGDDFEEELSAAAHDLERAIAGSPDPNPAYRSMLAKCYFLLGRYDDAAACYEAVHAAILKGHPLRRWSYICIAISYQRAGELAKAVEFLERCSRDFPEEAGIYFHKAKLYEQLGNLQSAHESLSKAVELKPCLGETFGISLALAAFSADQDAFHAGIESYLRSNPEVEKRLKALILSHWPSFAKLIGVAEACWLYGVLTLYIKPEESIIFRQRQEKCALGELALAVEVELRGMVFQRFKDRVGATPRLRELANRGGNEKDRLRLFANFLVGGTPFALGQMNTVLRYCQQYDDPLFAEFKSWVEIEVPSALGLVPRLFEIADIRNPDTHGEERTKNIDTNRFTRICREVLEELAQR
jgi:tetratricopeptide (TPR) repeat protein